jgi:hypothetical protein
MIALASDCLLFQMESGERVPLCADMISLELRGDEDVAYNEDVLQQATGAVFYYFKHDLARQVVTLGEFAEALEKVINGFALPEKLGQAHEMVSESDLGLLVDECGAGCELVFFPRLRDELRHRLKQGPQVLRFHGLRGCVKRLVGARRWCARCETLRRQIIQYLRECLKAEPAKDNLRLVVE